jgi:hypothetical protein
MGGHHDTSGLDVGVPSRGSPHIAITVFRVPSEYLDVDTRCRTLEARESPEAAMLMRC